MVESRALKVAFERSDEGFFRDHPDRRAHIRTAYLGESEGEFWSLGEHERKRRRIILWRVPEGNPFYDPAKRALLKIPFLAYADETIEDTDAVLLPIIEEVMQNALENYK